MFLLIFLCLRLSLLQSTWLCSANIGSLPFSILVTCLNHVSLLILSVSTIVSFSSIFPRIIALRILTRLCPSILLSQLISSSSCFLSYSLIRHQHSGPHHRTGITNVSYSFFFVLIDILFDLHIFLSPPNIAEARLILLLISFVHCASSVIRPSRKTNSVTCSSVSPSIFTSIFSGIFPIVIVFVFSPLIFSPTLLLLFWTLSVSSCSWCLSSAIRSIS